MTDDNITVLRARGRRLAKRVRSDGTIDAYDSARTYDLFTAPIADLAALATLLDRLLARPDCAVVRGAIIDPARTQGVRRRVHPDPSTGECPTLREAPRLWLALDVDSAERPEAVPAHDLPGCAAAAIRGLPKAFHDASCIVQASGSHGLKPGLRLRLWYWLSRPLTGPELKRWFRGVPVDPAVFRPAQVIYTAAPIFDRAADNPLSARMVAVSGASSTVTAPSAAALAPPRRPPAPLPSPRAPSANRYASVALTNAAARVYRAAEGRRHDTLLSEAIGLARFVAAGLLTESEVAETLRGAGEHVGKPGEECEQIVAWAIAHPSNRPLPAGIGR
ncbi:hypothetical protein [Limobrevibacterium gyesilva]|uniref:Uncharacterized protein n=1 Tax=Limobrevibacterium gyesilva TaxID=2991712 RepID=A0AA41YLZ3_9PROT|nr:hypothetical protein [Limobrevibacterium gyesilva]MCW3476331.1 hypothetical protein [Limobrevibacterium gyesilva]